MPEMTEPLEPKEPEPFLRIVKGDPTDEEVAALLAALAAIPSVADAKKRPVRERNSPYRQVRPFYSQGPGGWRSSGLPKHRGRGN